MSGRVVLRGDLVVVKGAGLVARVKDIRSAEDPLEEDLIVLDCAPHDDIITIRSNVEHYTKKENVQSFTKDTNPKDSIGISKTPMSTLSAPVLGEIGLGMMEGALKYGRHNYRVYGVRGSVYYDATMRHLQQWWEGEDYDQESKVGLHHISKAMASLAVLRDAMIQENWVDDRPPKSPSGWLQKLNSMAAALIAAFPNPKAAYTEKEKKQ